MTLFADSRYADGAQINAYDSRTYKIQKTIFRTWPTYLETFFFYNWVEGDRIELVSNLFLGRPDLWWQIMDLNPQILNPFNIAPGTQLRIPRAQ